MTLEQKKLKAWHAVEDALAKGTLTMPNVCEKCGASPAGKGGNNLQAHHDDYDKPLDVIFICKKCHMKLHHGSSVKKDNSTLAYKAALRQKLLKEIDGPVIMETHGGSGVLFDRCYTQILKGVVFEKNNEKALTLAKQRPGWFVYESNCITGIMAGAGKTLGINFVDIDPYGEPWPIIQAFFDSRNYQPDTLALAVNDGLRQKLKLNGAWRVNSMKQMVAKYGNQAMYGKYLEICREMIEEIAGHHGYKLVKWTGYYCGFAKQMTHYAAVLCR